MFFLLWGTGGTVMLDPGGGPYHFEGSRPVNLFPCSIMVIGSLKPLRRRSLSPWQTQPVGKPECGAPKSTITAGPLKLCWAPPTSLTIPIDGSRNHLYPASDTIRQCLADLNIGVYLRSTEARAFTLLDYLTLIPLLALCSLDPDFPFQQVDCCLPGMSGHQVVLVCVAF